MTNLKYNITLKEINIKQVMDKLLSREIIEQEASKIICKSLRQTQRIKKKYKEELITGLIHKLRGKAGNHKYDESKYNNALKIIKEKYIDYGPTLASEKLEENYNIKISVPTLRQEMTGYPGGYKSMNLESKDKKENRKTIYKMRKKRKLWRNGTIRLKLSSMVGMKKRKLIPMLTC